jgi:hypothetical protein
MIRLIKSPGSFYLVVGPVAHKSLETGFQLVKPGGFFISWRFRSRGDHAGISFSVQAFNLLFEWNFHDDRHWCWQEDRWFGPGEDEKMHDVLEDEDEWRGE